MTDVYLSLGSNLEPEKNIRLALLQLSREIGPLELSTVYITSPVKDLKQPDFYNCVARCNTSFSPHKLKFSLLRDIESSLGRKRAGDRFAARTIDIDLIIYGKQCIEARGLYIPDPDIRQRPFLALCLLELNSDLAVPCAKLRIAEVAATMSRDGMQPLHNYTRELRRELRHL